MQYSEHYEIHWRKRKTWWDETADPTGIETYETEHVAWDELDAMAKDPDVKHAILFRECTIELGRHAKATKP